MLEAGFITLLLADTPLHVVGLDIVLSASPKAVWNPPVSSWLLTDAGTYEIMAGGAAGTVLVSATSKGSSAGAFDSLAVNDELASDMWGIPANETIVGDDALLSSTSQQCAHFDFAPAGLDWCVPPPGPDTN